MTRARRRAPASRLWSRPSASIEPSSAALAHRSSGGPSRSSAQPSGIGRPSFAATITFPARYLGQRQVDRQRSTAAAREIRRRSDWCRRARALPPAAGIAAGEFPNASPTMRAAGDGLEVIRGDAEMVAVGHARERDASIRRRGVIASATASAHAGNARPQPHRRARRRPARARPSGCAAPSARPLRRCVAYCGNARHAVRREAAAPRRRRARCAVAGAIVGVAPARCSARDARSRSSATREIRHRSRAVSPSPRANRRDLVGDQRRHARVRFARDTRDVRRQIRGCGQRGERRSGAERLVVEHVERSAAEVVPPKRSSHGAASSTMPPRAVLIRIASGFIVREPGRVDQIARRRRQRHVQRDDVGLGGHDVGERTGRRAVVAPDRRMPARPADRSRSRASRARGQASPSGGRCRRSRRQPERLAPQLAAVRQARRAANAAAPTAAVA